MTAFDPDPLVRALAPMMRQMMLDAACQQAADDRRDRAEAIDGEIMRACRAVAHAADRLAQARFSGAAEGRAHQTLVKAAMTLGQTLRKHGRMPKGE